jgi:hypothetical protein
MPFGVRYAAASVAFIEQVVDSQVERQLIQHLPARLDVEHLVGSSSPILPIASCATVLALSVKRAPTWRPGRRGWRLAELEEQPAPGY